MMNHPFPTSASHDTETVRSRFYRFESVPSERKACRFSLVMPAHWHPLPLECNLLFGLRPLARWGANSGQRDEVHVDVIEMYRDVNPADWLEISYDAIGAKILQRRDAFGPYGKVSDLLVRFTVDDDARICRSILVKDGSKMFRVEVQVGESAYGELAEDLLLCLRSFTLLNPNGAPTAESVIEEKRDGDVPFLFQRFGSWPVRELVSDGRAKVLHLTSCHNEEVVGRIAIEVCRKSAEWGLQAIARDYAERLKSEGFHLQGAPIVPTKPPGLFDRAVLFAPPVSYAGHAFDSPVLLFEHDEALVLLALLGPTRQESPEWWAINKRAFEIVRDSLQILDTPGP